MMCLLLVGGSGHVGSMITPYLKAKYRLRVFDLKPPADPSIEFVAGSVSDPAAIKAALDGVEAFVWLVMQDGQGGLRTDQDVATIANNYEINTKGLHLFLYLSHQHGIRRGVYSSSMSVHFRGRDFYPGEEQVPRDSPSVYGLSKGLGEQICEYFARWFDMNIIGLRITGPRTRTQWLEERANPRALLDGSRVPVTDEEDLARAYIGALAAVQVGHGRFDAVFIAGDEGEKEYNLSKARRLLGWVPRSHLMLEKS